MTARAHVCVACGRQVRPDRGERLFWRPDGSEVWLHYAARCQEFYAGPDLPERPPAPMAGPVLEVAARG